MATTKAKRVVSHTVKTILGMKNELSALLPSSYTPDLTCTLNAKYRVFNTEAPVNVPILRYFGIGINGHYNVTDTNLSEARIPEMTNMDLYSPIPFICIPLTEDKEAYYKYYRMRVIENINSIPYVKYYLKPIQLQDTSVRIYRTDPVSKQEIVYELNPTNLHPVPKVPNTSGVISGTSTEINVAQRFLLPISGKEVSDVVNVIYDGDLRYAKLSEYGIYCGEERRVEGYDANNQVFTYTEAICAQLATHTCTIGTEATHPSAVLDRLISVSGGNVAMLDT